MNDEQRRLLQGRRNGWLATLMPDGTPQLTPVWVDAEGDDVIVNTPEGTVKLANMRRDSRVAVAIESEEDRYRTLSVRGTVMGFETEGAEEHISRLSLRHDGKPWEVSDGEHRIRVRIRPDRAVLLEG